MRPNHVICAALMMVAAGIIRPSEAMEGGGAPLRPKNKFSSEIAARKEEIGALSSNEMQDIIAGEEKKKFQTMYFGRNDKGRQVYLTQNEDEVRYRQEAFSYLTDHPNTSWTEICKKFPCDGMCKDLQKHSERKIRIHSKKQQMLRAKAKPRAAADAGASSFSAREEKKVTDGLRDDCDKMREFLRTADYANKDETDYIDRAERDERRKAEYERWRQEWNQQYEQRRRERERERAAGGGSQPEARESIDAARLRTAHGILGTHQGMSFCAVKLAYHRSAIRVHPDKNPDNPEATAEFQRLGSAYEEVKAHNGWN